MRKMLSGRPFVQSTDIGGCVFYREPENANVKLSPEIKLLRILGDNGNIVVSAYKKAENGKGYVIRLYNPTEKAIDFSLAFNRKPRAVSEISPDERIIIKDTLATDSKKLSLTLGAKKIITLFVK